jgi:hypothetical protein
MALNVKAAIVVIDAVLRVASVGPDLPDDFGGAGAAAVENHERALDIRADSPAAVPSVKFSAVVSAVAAPVMTQPRTVLVTATWCGYCPAAKAQWRREGRPESDIVDISVARGLGYKGSSVPVRFVVPPRVSAGTFALKTPYRSQWPPSWSINGSRNYSREYILKHLRTGGPHQGKHWQQWDLENWTRPQLAALHDDDHTGRVPVFDPPDAVSESVEAVLSDAPLSVGTLAAVLAMHMAPDDEPPAMFGALWNVDAEISEPLRATLRRLLVDQRLEFESAGISADWSGSDRSVKVGAGRLTLTPGVKVSATKWRVRVRATLNAVSYPQDLSSVTLELSGAPDLTVRLE